MAGTKKATTIPVYAMPAQATTSDICNWLTLASQEYHGDKAEPGVELPCILEFGSESRRTAIDLPDGATCKLASDVIAALWDMAEEESDRKYDRWLRRAWDTFAKVDALREAIAGANLPTVDETDEWWQESDVWKDQTRPGIMAAERTWFGVERCRAAIAGPPKRIKRGD